MDHLTVDPQDSAPPFEQLRRQIAGRVASGDLPAGTRLPTVRSLAAELDLATNTVARTYKELESDGVVVTEGRRGTFVAASAAAGSSEAASAAARYVAVARRLGLGLPEATRLLEQSW
jgi:DNA-binding transcriptional regulator YhcF (GntR family)